MELKQKFQFCNGTIETDTIELECVRSRKHMEVDLCFKSGMNIPFAQIKLYSGDLYRDANEVFDDACKLGDEICRRWNLQKRNK
jgi:hypothetical protein